MSLYDEDRICTMNCVGGVVVVYNQVILTELMLICNTVGTGGGGMGVAVKKGVGQ